jgi:acyl-CoA synthetase (AMP-forming)/AMP-acid ligase II
MHVGHLLSRGAVRYPDRPVWLGEDGAVTYAEGAERVNRLARALLALGVSGDRVAILSTNRFEALEAWLGVVTAGMAAVPLNPRLHADEYRYILQDAGAVAVVYDEAFDREVAAFKDDTPGIAHWFRIGGANGEASAYDELIAGGPADPPEVGIEPDDVAWLFYTSGTTGAPKGAMETHRNLLTMTQQFLTTILADAAPTDVMFHAAPVSHGTCSCMLPHLAVGAANAFPLTRSFEPPRVFEAIERYSVTTTFLAPTMVQMLLSAADRQRFDLSTLRTVVYGGAPMHVDLLRDAMAAFGPVFAQIYGQGEAPMTCTVLGKADHAAGRGSAGVRRLSSAGRETFAVHVAIVDDDDELLGPNQVGEVVVRGDLVMAGYWNRPEATAEALRGGWLHTGDVGYLDDDGYLFVTDRKKDMIISGGSNVYAREVEDAIASHPAVAEVAVVGVPDERWGECVAAIVVLRDGSYATRDDIVAACRDRLGSYKKPRLVEFVDALPKNAYGKVLKRELRERFTTASL